LQRNRLAGIGASALRGCRPSEESPGVREQAALRKEGLYAARHADG